jgi:hypothetical protein
VIGEEAKLSNPDETARQHMLDEASEKLHRRKRHRPTLPVLGVVLPPKGNPVTIKRE